MHATVHFGDDARQRLIGRRRYAEYPTKPRLRGLFLQTVDDKKSTRGHDDNHDTISTKQHMSHQTSKNRNTLASTDKSK